MSYCYCDRINCGYYYQNQDDDFPYCHCPDNVLAPCEEDDWED